MTDEKHWLGGRGEFLALMGSLLVIVVWLTSQVGEIEEGLQEVTVDVAEIRGRLGDPSMFSAQHTIANPSSGLMMYDDASRELLEAILSELRTLNNR